MQQLANQLPLHLFWFRRDLRIADNQGFWQACRYPDIEVWPIFIIDPYFFHEWPEIGQLRVKFMFESLQDLDLSLRKLGSCLFLLEGRSTEVWEQVFCQAQNQFALSLYFNRDRQIAYGHNRDQQVLVLAKRYHCKVYIGSSNFLLLNSADMPHWRQKYYEHQKQPLFPTPNNIRTTINLAKQFWSQADIQLLTLAEFQEKYKAFLRDKSQLFTCLLYTSPSPRDS